ISSSVAVAGDVLVGAAGQDDLLYLNGTDPNIALELRSGTFGGNPFIDFANDAVSDYDARIQLLGDAGLKIDVPSTLAIPTGKVGIGTTTPGSLPGILQNSRLEVADANGLNSDVSLRVSGGGATGSASLNYAKSRGTLPSPTSVQSGDFLGNITFVGHDGTDFGSIAAWIRGVVDGTPGADDMPGRLEFLTTPDGSATPSTQMTITNAGKVGIGTTTPGTLPGILQNSRLEVADGSGLNSDVSLRVSGGGATGSASLNYAKSRGALPAPTIVQSGDFLGNITFVGYDGADFGSIAAWIRGAVDGTPGVDDMPGRLEFLTTPDGLATPFTRMTVNNVGNVGIGTTGPVQALHVSKNGTNTAIMVEYPTARARIGMFSFGLGNNEFGFGPVDLQFGTISDNTFSGFSEKMRITTAGNVGIGTTAPAALLHVNGTAGNNTGVWSNLSDRRLKREIEPIERALETVEQLKGVTFRWKDAEKDDQFGRVRGLIAQDVEKVIPEWIKTDPDGYKRLEPIGVDALLIEAIKELKAENEELRNRISELEKAKPQAKVE
ncbi:MAG: tail fiber domain-containing protein, partial [candidate division Zixibacteria bacterium]|nr:tail fiber domain-containing protein [candidate division Zixibacteria bacterium]